MANRLMIIEDELLLGEELKRRFAGQGYDVTLVRTIARAEKLLLCQLPLVVISDMSLPDGNGLELFTKLGKELGCEWLFLTAYGSVPDSVRALQLGAYDFLEKPRDLERIDMVVASALRSALAQQRLQDRSRQQSGRYPIEAFLGESSQAVKVRDLLQRLSQVVFSALILSGESGTGKGLVAKILHHNSARSEAPFIELNCAALPRDLLESELFGHESGAFTGATRSRRGLFEQADGGTLFLDEIGEMPLELQSKLLKAIEDQKIRRLGGEKEIQLDIQIIAATNRELPSQVATGAFRSDLYHRLGLFEIALPALRQRLEDLQQLVPRLIQEFNLRAQRHVTVIPEQAWQRLQAHHWPGNIRELRNVIERCVLFAEGECLPLQWLQLTQLEQRADRLGAGQSLHIPLDGSMKLEEVEKYVIQAALQRCDNNTSAAAQMLGTTRETLRYRKQKYQL